MKRNLFLALLLIILLCSPSHSEEKKGWASFSLTGGGYSFDDQLGLDNELLYGFKVAYEIEGKTMRDRLGLEAVYQKIDGTSDDLNADVSVTLLRLDVLYRFKAIKGLKNISPYLSIGAGGQFVDGDLGSSHEPLVAYGLGFRYPLTNSIDFRADLRHVMIFADESMNEFEYTAGLQYTFGRPKKVKPKKTVQKDSDNDGVFDGRDQCPDTPPGLKVNDRGCPVNPPDTDGDGVPDYLDQCEGTEAGYPVDSRGCLFDQDGDGVADPFDKCPNNPPGFEVNADGCMKISQ